MPVRSVTLNASKAGMTRLRDKGGASPETLFELTNAYINASRSPTQRPGTTWVYQFGANTHGLVAFQGVFYSFTDNPASIVNTGNYQVVLLRNPVAGSAATLSKVTYAVPFMGYLYVVGVYSDGTAHHFWLQNPPAWQRNSSYSSGQLVQPSPTNGYYYSAQLLSNPPQWRAHLAVNQGTTVQPTKYNSFFYQATNVVSPTSIGGTTIAFTAPNEPVWSTSLGGITLDISGGNPSSNPNQINPPPAPPPQPAPGTGPGGRYGNRNGDNRVEQP